MARNPEFKPGFRQRTAIGLMSGTSMDGIDVALLATDGRARVERGPGASYPYEPAFRNRLDQALVEAAPIAGRDERPGGLADLEREIALRHAGAVRRFLEERNLRLSDIDLIGFHGQTVLHRPDRGFTVQLGDGQLLADKLGVPVVWDLRANDMVHGGQGAPLVPAYHRALARNLPPEAGDERAVVFVNIGGIANMTFVSREGDLIAFDTGPGNALIDQWVMAHAGIPYDPDGAIGSEGAVIGSVLEPYLALPFLARHAPKSLDRNDFALPPADAASLEDGARTLARLTAVAIARGLDLLPERPGRMIVCGGGRRNRTILLDLEELLAGPQSKVAVVTAEAVGLDGDAMEAEAWAYLAVRALNGDAITWPGTTGVSAPVSGGRISYPVSPERK